MNIPPQSLFDRLGGREGIASLIDPFYERVVADPSLAPFFKDVNLANLKLMQQEFFGVALGGPLTYSGTTLWQAHAGKRITLRHFSRYVTLLLETLTEIGISPEDVSAVVDRIATYVYDITGDTTMAE